MTDREIIEDIRRRLKGYGDSRLHGDGGLVQATMNAWDASERDRERLAGEVEALHGRLRQIAQLSVQDVNTTQGFRVLGKIERIARGTA